jgi:hypothetical protein
LGPAGADRGRAPRRGLNASGGSRSPLELPHLVANTELLYIPDAERPRLLVPLDGAAVRFALERLGRQTPRWRVARLAGRLGLGRAVLAARFPVRAATPQPDAEPLLGRLRALTGEPGPFVVHVGTGGELVVFLLRGRAPAAVAKVSAEPARLEREARALREVGELARAAGADVPRPLAEDAGVLVETPVAGRPLAWTLAGAARRLPRALERLAEWLAAWHGLTARPVEPTRERLEAELLTPARQVADAVHDPDAYLRAVVGVGRRAEGATIPLVAAHEDLTSINVLGDRGGLGVVDWEQARADGWPLTDFLYAAADLAAAVDRHRSRLDAFDDCFVPGRRWAALVARLERRLREVVGLTPAGAELCFQVCWTRHAANELRASGGRPGEFVGLAERAARLAGTR